MAILKTQHLAITDGMGRPMRDLRISITDRCNFRCSYCMPRHVFNSKHCFLRHKDLLRFEEIGRLARVFVSLGVRKLRITGGEPLLRHGVEELIEILAAIRTPEGDSVEVVMTTNGSLLASKAQKLAEAGLNRINVSLDALDNSVFQLLNCVDFPVDAVLDGILAAQQAGLTPVKVNMVVQRGINDNQIMPMIERFRGTPTILRFIEFMDVGNTNDWKKERVVPSSEVLALIRSQYGMHTLDPTVLGETAKRWMFDDGSLQIGLISSISETFCQDCNRARLSMDGKLHMCLFTARGHDLRILLRGDSELGAVAVDDAALTRVLTKIWQKRDDRYSEQRHSQSNVRKVEMSYIGG